MRLVFRDLESILYELKFHRIFFNLSRYKIVLDSDAKEFGGHERITKYQDYFTEPVRQHGRDHRIFVRNFIENYLILNSYIYLVV